MVNQPDRGSMATSNSISPKLQAWFDKVRANSRVPEAGWDDIDFSLWKQPILKENLTETHASTFVLKFIEEVRPYELVDDALLHEFRMIFEDWDLPMFNAIGTLWKRELKMFLRENGVFTGPTHGRIAPQLATLMALQAGPEWPDNELRVAKICEASQWHLPALRAKGQQTTAADTTQMLQPANPQAYMLSQQPSQQPL